MMCISELDEFSGGERNELVLAGTLCDGLYVLICPGYGKLSAACKFLVFDLDHLRGFREN
jgi:hypothetical protein